MIDLMVDVEALGAEPGGVITQIGACYFERYTGAIGEQFEVNIRIQSCLDEGLFVTGETLKWWFEQENRTWLKDAVDLRTALTRFGIFAHLADCAWAHGGFDFPVLYAAYKKCGIKVPVHYKKLRDIRTLVDFGLPFLSLEERERSAQIQKHDALQDCIYQVGYVSKLLKKLKDVSDKAD